MEKQKLVELAKKYNRGVINKKLLFCNIFEVLYKEKKCENIFKEFCKFKSVFLLQSFNAKNKEENTERIVVDLSDSCFAFLISYLHEEKDLEKYKTLIGTVKKSMIEKYSPGIISYILNLLVQSRTDEKADLLSILNYVLCCITDLPSIGKNILFDTLSVIERDLLSSTSIICKNIYKDERSIFFLQNLVVNNIMLSDEELTILKNDVNEKLLCCNIHIFLDNKIEMQVFRFLIANKKIVIGNDFWNYIRKLHNSNAIIDELIELIQEHNVVENPILDLLPITENNYIKILNCKDQYKINAYIKRMSKPLLEFETLMLYLENKGLHTAIDRIYNVSQLAVAFENKIMTNLFLRLDKIIKCSKKLSIKKGFLCKKGTFFDFEEELKKFLHLCLELLKIHPSCNFILLRNLLLSVLDKIESQVSCFQIFRLLNNVHDLSIKSLMHFFDKILYVDLDSSTVRSIKYDTLGNIIRQINIIAGQSKEREQSEGFVTNHFMFPMIAALFDELSITPEDYEVSSVLRLLQLCIKCSGSFLQKRFFEADILNFYSERYTLKNVEKYKSIEYKAFLNLLNKMLSQFELSKEQFERLLIYLCSIYDLFDTKTILKRLIAIDPYLSFYCLFIQKACSIVSNDEQNIILLYLKSLCITSKNKKNCQI